MSLKKTYVRDGNRKIIANITSGFSDVPRLCVTLTIRSLVKSTTDSQPHKMLTAILSASALPMRDC
jgi:hypothetical protein